MQLVMQNLVQQFGQGPLFAVDYLSINNQELVQLQGANGSGKTTLMKIMAGLLKPTKGQVYLEPPANSVPKPAVIYLHQHPYFFDTHVRGNVEYGLRKLGKLDDDKVDKMLAWAQLEDIQMRPAYQLSGGEKQRLALARALVLSPQIMLLDEPSSNLDAASRQRIQALIMDLTKQGTGCVVACHQDTLPAAACDRQLKLAQGQLAVLDNHLPAMRKSK